MSDEIETRPGLASVYCQRINSWHTLIARTKEHQDLKYISAEYFHRLIVTRILAAGVTRLFFESGSSIAILARTFRKFVESHGGIERLPALSIETNNILACLEFELFGTLSVTLYPPGPPEDKYGATFGPLQQMLPLPPPTHSSRELGCPETTMGPIRNHISDTFRKNGIIFMSASGLELNDSRGFQGPHVGSYPNMIFKRILLQAGCPTVMFMDQSKIYDGAFIEGTCYPVCDQKLTWAKICNSHPFALVIGADDRDKLDPVLNQFRELGLTSQRVERKGTDFGLVLANRAFENRFPEHCDGLHKRSAKLEKVNSDEADSTNRQSTLTSNSSKRVTRMRPLKRS